MSSANLAIGTASVFVLVMAAASLAVDREPIAGPTQAAWRLRGSLSTIDIREKGVAQVKGSHAKVKGANTEGVNFEGPMFGGEKLARL